MNHKSIWSIFRQTFSDWSAHEAPRLGAALAFYTILSMAPLVILVIAIAALVFGRTTAQSQLLHQVESLIGTQGSDAVKTLIEHAQKPGTGILASVIGLVTLLFGASAVFGELRDSLNKIWRVRPKNQNGVWAVVKQRFFSVGMVLAVGFLLLVSLAVSAVLAAFGQFFGDLLPLPEYVLSVINFVVSLAGVAVLFALIFRYVPEKTIPWKELWIGAGVTAILFTIGKSLIGIYLGKAAVGSAYGAAGSLVGVIVWVYYSAMIFFFGAEFTHVLVESRRKKVESAPREVDAHQ